MSGLIEVRNDAKKELANAATTVALGRSLLHHRKGLIPGAKISGNCTRVVRKLMASNETQCTHVSEDLILWALHRLERVKRSDTNFSD
jgi:hypothetical protein